MTKIMDAPVRDAVPTGGYVIISEPVSPGSPLSTFAKVPGSAIGGGSGSADLSTALLNDRAPDGSGGGGDYLPLTGGTITTHLTGAAYGSSVNFATTAVGSGVNGPATAQTSLSISLQKDGWNTGTAAVGEIDGLVINCRQGGAGSDCGGMLIDVQNTGQGFVAIAEAISSIVQTVAPYALTHGVNLQLGALSPLTGEHFGMVTTAHVGALTCAHQVMNEAGGSWIYAYRVVKDNVVTYTVDQYGDVSAAGVVAQNVRTGGLVCDGETSSGDLRAAGHLYMQGSGTAISVKYNNVTNALDFAVGNPTFSVAGSGTVSIFNQQVLQPRISGWGTATNGSRNPFDAATATLPQTAAALAQLITDLRTHGLIGT